MSLIAYIIKALCPKILCDDSPLLQLCASQIIGKEYYISSDLLGKYDIIISHYFDKQKYDTNLNYDGFYFFTKGADHVVSINKDKIDYEYIQYAGFGIVRKGGYEDNSISNNLYKSAPFWATPNENKEKEDNPIILRNFRDKFNVIPYVEPFEIIDHPTIIMNLCKEFGVKRYLELGVRACPVPNLIKDIVPMIVGVDTNNTPNFPGIFYKGTTDQFFEACKTDSHKTIKTEDVTFDMVFIDACHDYEYVKRDFINALRYTKIGGLVLLHDTYPAVEYMTDKSLCSDAYRIVDYIRKCGLQMLNIPISPGLCIVKV